MAHHHKSRGFSLVELSIVLVILGLLVGGILAGQSLIRAAELRSVSTEYSRYLTAMHSFRDKYFALPGDMNNATSFWGKDNTNCAAHTGTNATPGTCNGNNNAVLNLAASASATGENYRFWQHLALAGLIEGTYTGLAGGGSISHAMIGTNAPRSKLNNAGWSIYPFPTTIAIDNAGWANFEGTYGNQFLLGAEVSTSVTEGRAIKAEEAWNIDTKLDDGKPGTGTVRTYENRCNDNTYSTTLPRANIANYRLNDTSIDCNLLFNM